MRTTDDCKSQNATTSKSIPVRLAFHDLAPCGLTGHKPHRSRSALELVLIAMVVALELVAVSSESGAVDVVPFTVSIPMVTEPIPSTATNYPFIANGFSIAPPLPAGYAEEEYFVSGTANIYEWTPAGVQIATPCPACVTPDCTNTPYTTRLLVKHPIDPAEFSGTVIIQPFNPTANFDIAGIWDRSHEYFVRNGDIYVGWTAKSVAVNALKTFNPIRYATLNWPYAPFVPGGNSGAYDGLTFDIAAQIGALLKTNGPTSPTHAFNVERVFEAGFSQDGGFTFAQINGFHNLERLPGGGPIYDGYSPQGTGGPSNINFGLTPAGALPADDPRRQIQPRDVPVIHVNTETEVFLGAAGGLPYRRPDSDAPNDRYRLWEVTGASHADDTILTGSAAWGGFELTGELFVIAGCGHTPPLNDFPFKYVANAAFAALTAWGDAGIAPPRAGRLQLTATPPITVARDALGNALGGLRTPFVDVPIASYFPSDTGPGFCRLVGYKTPFSDDTLDSLYKNHGDYVHQVVQETNELVQHRFWLKADAKIVKTDAAHASVP